MAEGTLQLCIPDFDCRVGGTTASFSDSYVSWSPTSISLKSTSSCAVAVVAVEKERCHPVDKKALLAIKQSVLKYGTDFPSWNPDNDCCRFWDGVKCDSITHRVSTLFIVGSDGIPSSYYSGAIPEAIGDLSALTLLRFHKLYNITGTIPTSISKLQSLRWADFSWNGISGPVPNFFHRMKSLSILYLSYNSFSGSVPPELAMAPSLTGLDLSRNSLTGSIPLSFGSFLNPNMHLTLSHNNLSGPLPKSLANVQFQNIDLSKNHFTGDAAFLFDSHSLETIDLSRNMFSFNLSKVVMPSSLISLDINHNRIYGSLPDGIADLQQLQMLNVTYNRLCGQIPTGDRMNKFDKTSYAHNKCLCGSPLPACALPIKN